MAAGTVVQQAMSAALGSYYETLARYTGAFTVIGEDGNRFSAQWEFEPSIPTKRALGITGWARIGGEGGHRLHICAHSPCGAHAERCVPPRGGVHHGAGSMRCCVCI